MTMTLVFLAMGGFLAIGLPIAFTLGLASAIFYLTVPGVSPAFLVQRMVASTESFPLLAVPFFIFAGAVMTQGGISHRVLRLARPPPAAAPPGAGRPPRPARPRGRGRALPAAGPAGGGLGPPDRRVPGWAR